MSGCIEDFNCIKYSGIQQTQHTQAYHRGPQANVSSAHQDA